MGVSTKKAAGARFWLTGVLGTAIAFAAACASSDGGTSSGAPAPGAVDVGPEGKTITLQGVTLTIPPGALHTRVAIRVTDDEPAPAGYAVSGKVYR